MTAGNPDESAGKDPYAPLIVGPLSPQNGAEIPADAREITLVTLSANTSPTTEILQTFEVAGEAAFSTVLQTQTVIQGAGGQTSVTFPVIDRGKTYYWRVRSAIGEYSGRSSAPWTFVISPNPGIVAPILVEPAEGSTTGPRPTLKVVNAVGSTGVKTITYLSELATDPLFQSIAFSKTGVEGLSNFTLITTDLPAGDIYWRLRATTDTGQVAMSSVRHFTVSSTTRCAEPTTLQPAFGAMANQQPTLVVMNSPHVAATGSLSVWYSAIVVANAPVFNGKPIVGSGFAYEIAGTTTTAMPLDRVLAPGTYYWKAQVACGPGSDWSEPSMFVVPPARVESASLVSPAKGALVHGRPTLTVGNPPRTGPVGALMYRFDVAFGTTFSAGAKVASETVPEGAGGQTSWTVPFNLVPGQHYSWRVEITDTNSHVSSPALLTSDFWVAAAIERLYVLDVTTPPCRTSVDIGQTTFYGASSDAIGDPSFTLRTESTLTVRLSGGANVSGTIGGQAKPANVTDSVTISTKFLGTDAAATSGVVASDGTLTGTFDGLVWIHNPAGSSTCGGPGSRWVIRPRTE